MTLEQLKSEKEFIGTMTREEYIKVSRTGRTLKLNRADRNNIYTNIDKMISWITPCSRTIGQLRNDKANLFYDAICTERDESMLLTA